MSSAYLRCFEWWKVFRRKRDSTCLFRFYSTKAIGKRLILNLFVKNIFNFSEFKISVGMRKPLTDIVDFPFEKLRSKNRIDRWVILRELSQN